MSSFLPSTGSIEAWNAAYYRLEDYLRAHGVGNKARQAQIILRLLERAAIRHQQDPEAHPLRLAMEELSDEIELWFDNLLPGLDGPAEKRATYGRVALHMIDAPNRWPNAFLNWENLPPDFTRALQEATMSSAPNLSISSMIPRNPAETLQAAPRQDSWTGFGKYYGLLVGGAAAVLAAIVAFLKH